MARRFWLIFAQTVTLGLAAIGLIHILAPQWLPKSVRPNASVLTLQEATPGKAALAQGVASYREATQKALPSMVNIFTRKEARVTRNPLLNDPRLRQFFGNNIGPQTQPSTSLGSGVIVSPEGYIVTNNHVIEAADEIAVSLSDGRQFAAHVVGADPESDLAIIKIEASSLQPVTFGHIEDTQIGDVVLAIGNPFGVGQTVTMGIVSAMGRSKLGINAFENFIQTDAPINPGNSGGALIDTQGKLIGINTAIFSSSGGSLGIGFAIPENTVRDVLKQLIEKGMVVRGWAGVATQDISPQLAATFHLNEARGAIVTGLLLNGPGARAGIRVADIILEIENQPVSGSDELRNRIAALAPGDKAVLTIFRAGKTMNVTVKVEQRPAPVGGEE